MQIQSAGYRGGNYDVTQHSGWATQAPRDNVTVQDQGIQDPKIVQVQHSTAWEGFAFSQRLQTPSNMKYLLSVVNLAPKTNSIRLATMYHKDIPVHTNTHRGRLKTTDIKTDPA